MYDFEIAQVESKFDEILDKNYPNREKVIKIFSRNVFLSIQLIEELHREFVEIYTGNKDVVEEFKVLLAAAYAIATGARKDQISKKVNDTLDVVDSYEKILYERGGVTLDDNLEPRLLHPYASPAPAPVGVKKIPLENVWKYRSQNSIVNIPQAVLQSISAGVYVKVVAPGESFWCKIVEILIGGIFPRTYIGLVDNDLVYTRFHDLKADDRIVISDYNIKDLKVGSSEV